jgi:myo-inositol-1(or 4)-monophosphatase
VSESIPAGALDPTTDPAGPASSLARLAAEVAQEAGGLLREHAAALHAGADLRVRTKSSTSDPVSAADRAAERLIGARLAAARPDDGMLGEEGEAGRVGTSGLTWVVDPLDGTVNFLYGNPMWSVSVACVDAEGPLAGAVHDPNRDETFVAWRGGGAHLRDDRLRVTELADPTGALVATGFAYDPTHRAAWGRSVAALLARTRDVRRAGSAALDLAWCAAGRVDGYVEFGLEVWDWAAGRLLVEEAGGKVSDQHRSLGGEPLLGLVAGNGAVHDHLVRFLQETDDRGPAK